MRISFNVRNSFFVYISVFVLFLFLLPSCVNTKKLIYLQGKFDTAQLSQIHIPEALIQRGDQLSIAVFSDNPQASAIYNQSQGGSVPMGGMSSAGVSGSSSAVSSGISPTPVSTAGGSYIVDGHGNIDFPNLGLMHIEGLTRDQLKDTLHLRLDSFLLHPYFVIRFTNSHFTIIGEVAKPGVFAMPGDHINLLEAFSMAGDLAQYARRDSILVIRQNSGVRQFARLDITKPEIMASPYFYLQSNDIVYVEASRKKAIANDQVTTRNISIVATLLSIVVIVVTLIKLN